jgi:hypothetical protein
MFVELNDVARITTAWVGVTILVLVWIHLTRPPSIPLTLYAAFVIAVRLLFLYATSYAFFTLCLGVPVNVLVIISILILVLAPLARPDFVPGNDVLQVAVGLTVMAPVSILKQLILGFPDHDQIVLQPPAVTATVEYSHLIQATGTVMATLKPSGKVTIANRIYPATTADGKYLDQGTAIRVTGVRNGTLIVLQSESREVVPEA